MNRTTKMLSVFTLMVLASSPVLAQANAAPKPLVVTAENLMAGDSQRKAVSGGRNPNELLPGDVVRYRLTFTNVTPHPVKNVVFENPLPAGLSYQAASAASDRDQVAITYSIDGGKSYSAQPMIEVQVDGKRVQRPAPSEMYTHIRWSVQGSVLPGSVVHAEFRAQLAPRSNSATAK